MEKLLLYITVILIIAWVTGFIGFNTGGIIHGLMIIAVIAIIVKFFRDEGFIKRLRNGTKDVSRSFEDV